MRRESRREERANNERKEKTEGKREKRERERRESVARRRVFFVEFVLCLDLRLVWWCVAAECYHVPSRMFGGLRT